MWLLPRPQGQPPGLDTVGGVGGEPKEREEGPECRPTHFSAALDRPFPTLTCVLECGGGRLGQC